MASKEMIKTWLEEAKDAKAAYMLVVCDTFDYSDYPVRVKGNKEVLQTIAKYYHGRNMQRVMECYDLSLDIDKQLGEFRAWHGWHPSEENLHVI